MSLENTFGASFILLRFSFALIDFQHSFDESLSLHWLAGNTK